MVTYKVGIYHKDAEKTAIYKPGSKVSEESNPTDTF